MNLQSQWQKNYIEIGSMVQLEVSVSGLVRTVNCTCYILH